MAQKYLGITPYGEDGSFEFVGRSEETWALYDRIIRNEYTVYYAASGEGKSSLIRAGLLPILRRRNFYPVYIVFEDKELEDLSSIESVINNRIGLETESQDVTYEQSTWSKSRFSQEMSERLKNNSWWRLRNYCFKQGGSELKPLFIFDQFEEVFTKANYDWTDHFFSWLEIISTDYLPDSLQEIYNSRDIDMPTQKNFKALFSFRTEFLGDLDYWCVQKHFIPSLQENRMCLKPLTPKGAKEIINLDESSLGKYADKIIQGCAESETSTKNIEQPCVYALILSVVCLTLSELPDNERINLLENLNNQQDVTIDDILLRFYKKKLQAVGLDYIKNENIIADIENALVDEKGKRSRRDTDEASMRPIAKWIERLCDKSNGLLKVIGKKKVNGQTVNTVEFPHDRLCKAIDSSRKERQGKISWRLNRQGEWIQFGIISTVIGIIAFLWNALLPSIKPVVTNAISNTGFNNVRDLFIHNYLNWEWHPSKYVDYSLDEGFSTLFLMVSLILFLPLITIFIVRKSKTGHVLSTLISLFSSLSFVFLWHKNKNLSFTNSYVPIFTFIGLLFSSASLCMSILKMRNIYSNGESVYLCKSHYSNWPLWGGYLIFSCYVFYECLFRTTFGGNEPCDSTWALIAIPLFYTLWAWSFFNMTLDDKGEKRMLFANIVSVFFLILLFIIGNIPFYNSFKQIYGFNLSVIIILIWLSFSTYIVWHSKSKSYFYVLSKSKRFFAVIFGALLIITTFILNLGFNPFVISPKTVCHVASWRDVMVYERDSIVGIKLGFLYSTSGDTIIPCCIPASVQINSLLAKGEYPFISGRIPVEAKFTSSPFSVDTILKNGDNSLNWNPSNHIITAYIPVTSTLEQYLHRKLNSGLSSNSSFKDSIDYYAAKLFYEIRTSNILYVLEEKTYNLNSLGALEKLDSLQHIALSKELNKFSVYSQDTTITSSGRENIRSRIEVLEDKHLIDFHCELSRSFLLCLIKDRVSQSDMPSMFNIASTYLMSFFTSVPSMNIHLDFQGVQDLTLTTSANSGTINRNITKMLKYDIYSDDILNRRFFAWYDLFNCLCIMDMGWNSSTFENIYSNNEQLYGALDTLLEIAKEMLPVLEATTTTVDDIIENSKNTASSVSLLIENMERILRARDPNFYESILARMEKISLSINTIEVDQSLKQLKDDVFRTLLPIMEKREDGIYNNDFENICKKLILVSVFRGNDIQNDTTRLSNYLTKKNDLYFIVKGISNIHGNTDQVLQQKNEIEEKLKELIYSFRKSK